MKIRVEYQEDTENEIIIRYNQMNDEILHILSFLKTQSKKICVYKTKDNLIVLEIQKVLYIEALDEKTFVYTVNDVYQTSLTLYEIEARYSGLGYCRISKSMIVNIHQIHALKNIGESRIEVTMNNQEKVLISRHYAPIFREIIGI